MKKSFIDFLIDINEEKTFFTVNDIDREIIYSMYRDYHGTQKEIDLFLQTDECIEKIIKPRDVKCKVITAIGMIKTFDTLKECFHYALDLGEYKKSYYAFTRMLSKTGKIETENLLIIK